MYMCICYVYVERVRYMSVCMKEQTRATENEKQSEEPSSPRTHETRLEARWHTCPPGKAQEALHGRHSEESATTLIGMSACFHMSILCMAPMLVVINHCSLREGRAEARESHGA